jgi:hypothetical protein
MKERGWIELIVERVVGQVLDSHANQLRTEIVRRVMEEIASAPELDESGLHEQSFENTASASGSADLAHAVAEIQSGTSQREILRALLDTGARYAARVALFVVKGGHATGWQGRGFANSDALKDFALDGNAPAVVRAISGRAATNVPVADLDPRFLRKFGKPSSGEARILPLMLKDKVAALVYADSGTDATGSLNAGSLELLVLSTSAWLEVNSLRKQAQKEPPAQQADSQTVAAAEAHQTAVHAVSAYSDPFASQPAVHPPLAMAAAAAASDAPAPQAMAVVEVPPVVDHQAETMAAETTNAGSAVAESMTAEAIAAEAQAEATMEAMTAPTAFESAVVEMEPALAEPLPINSAPFDHPSEHRSELAPEAPQVSSLSTEDQDVHRKAQRFARLLVDEIKLYNQAKVAEGRNNKDLYDRLKEVIEKSRVTYQKRYGITVAASANYFQHEIIRSLAEDDLSIMGANFRQ